MGDDGMGGSLFSPGDLPKIVGDAARALTLGALKSIGRHIPGELSQRFVKGIAIELKKHVAGKHTPDQLKVLWRGSDDRFMGLKEFLFDLAVVEIGTALSYNNSPQPYIKRLHLAGECELAPRGNELLKDYSKLRVATAPVKLLVVHKSDHESPKELLEPICDGALVLCIVLSPPSKWLTDWQDPDRRVVASWLCERGKWNRI